MAELLPILHSASHGSKRGLHGRLPALPRARNPDPLIGRVVIRREVDPAHGFAVAQNLAVISPALSAYRDGSVRPHAPETAQIMPKEQAHG